MDTHLLVTQNDIAPCLDSLKHTKLALFLKIQHDFTVILSITLLGHRYTFSFLFMQSKLQTAFSWIKDSSAITDATKEMIESPALQAVSGSCNAGSMVISSIACLSTIAHLPAAMHFCCSFCRVVHDQASSVTHRSWAVTAKIVIVLSLPQPSPGIINFRSLLSNNNRSSLICEAADSCGVELVIPIDKERWQPGVAAACARLERLGRWDSDQRYMLRMDALVGPYYTENGGAPDMVPCRPSKAGRHVIIQTIEPPSFQIAATVSGLHKA